MARTTRRAALALVAAALLLPAAARAAPVLTPSAGQARRHWALPDQAKLQFAGNVGFLSPGVGYAWLGRKLEADLFFGWVPPPFGGEHIVATTAKLTWLPWHLSAGDWKVRPLTLAFQVTYTFGAEYWVVQPDRYPKGYYQLPTAINTALALGAAAGRPLWGLEEVGAYLEFVALDTVLTFWLANRGTIDIQDAFSAALGARVAF
jgi:hypothetical protein